MIFRPTLRFLTRPRPPTDFAARRLAAAILPPLLFFAIVESPSLLGAFLQGRLQLDGEWVTGLPAGIVRRDGKRRTAYGVRARWRTRSTRVTRSKTHSIDPGVPRD